MKNLVLGSLMAVVVSQSAGCIISSSDEDARLSASWRFENIANGGTTGCPTGFDTAAVYSQPVDVNGNPLGTSIKDLFDCADFAGITAPLAPDLYQVWIEITNTSGTQVYAQSASAFVDLTVSDKSFDASILNDGGYFDLAWNLVDAASNAPLSCAQAQSQGVSVLSTSVANQSDFVDDIFDCEDGYGVTAGLLAGTYTVSVSALGAGDAPIGTAPTLANQVIQAPNKFTSLGTVTIPID